MSVRKREVLSLVGVWGRVFYFFLLGLQKGFQRRRFKFGRRRRKWLQEDGGEGYFGQVGEGGESVNV